jgi:hypothetical protein
MKIDIEYSCKEVTDMTLQMNTTALLNKGYRIVAEYTTWKKYESSNEWMAPTTYTCFKKGENCVVKVSSRRHCFTKDFDSKEEANAFIQSKLRSCGRYSKNKKF